MDESYLNQLPYYEAEEVYGGSAKYHRRVCHTIQKIWRYNLKRLPSWKDAVAIGLKPCGVCNPYFRVPSDSTTGNPESRRSLSSTNSQSTSDSTLPLPEVPALREALNSMLSGIPNKEEDAYLQEAAACVSANLFRGAAVLGWCATIDRIHRVIEQIGFNRFNTVSHQMNAAQSGRFKRFSKPQNVSSIGELREVFDTEILWILEGMQLIDSNQHTRLRSCFDLRCQCAHPGEAPVTEYNLLSFFSDISAIVLANPKFRVDG